MTAVPLGETPSLCVLCPQGRERVARSGGMTCWNCHDRISEQLGEIVQRYARLSARPHRSGDFGRRAPGFHSRPPVDMAAATLRDPRTAPVELGEPHAPLNLAISWSTWIRTQRRQTPRVAYPLDDLAVLDFEWRYLTASLDWITRQPWIVELAAQLKACVSQMRSAAGEPNPRPVGKCACGHPLFPPASGMDVVCSACDAPYDPLEQIRMAASGHLSCGVCGHPSAQHSHDEDPRRCNMDWCDCEGFEDMDEEQVS